MTRCHNCVVPTTPTPCVVRNELAAKVAEAIKETYQAKDGLRKIEALKRDPARFIRRLSEARRAEREAVSAFETHRREHGC
jgi:ParB-like chromosome segregation protein Spo0J